MEVRPKNPKHRNIRHFTLCIPMRFFTPIKNGDSEWHSTLPMQTTVRHSEEQSDEESHPLKIRIPPNCHSERSEESHTTKFLKFYFLYSRKILPPAKAIVRMTLPYNLFLLFVILRESSTEESQTPRSCKLIIPAHTTKYMLQNPSQHQSFWGRYDRRISSNEIFEILLYVFPWDSSPP